MKRISFFILLLSLCFQLSAEYKKPKTGPSIGLGAGCNYGGYGGKILLGNNNSGAIFGLGKMGDFLGYNIGVQIAPRPFYFNLNLSSVGIYQYKSEPAKMINAYSFLFGGMIPLNKKGSISLDLSIGQAKFAEIFNDEDIPDGSGICFGIGVNFASLHKTAKSKIVAHPDK